MYYVVVVLYIIRFEWPEGSSVYCTTKSLSVFGTFSSIPFHFLIFLRAFVVVDIPNMNDASTKTSFSLWFGEISDKISK